MIEFTLGFNSAEYHLHDDHVDVEYMNGEHILQVGLTVQGSTDEIFSNQREIELDNDDVLLASLSGLGEGAANASTGQMWYGGPGASVEITAKPVVYSGGDVSSVTLLGFCGDDAATDSEAPFVFEVDCDGYTSDKDGDGDKPEFTVGGDDIGARASAVYLDFEGPTAPHFNANPNGREGGWVNQAVLVATAAGPYHATRNKDGWLVYNRDEEGVGGYAPQVRFSSTTPVIVDAAREATPNALPTEPTRANAVCVIATAVDLLGNESGLPRAGSDCVTAANYTGDGGRRREHDLPCRYPCRSGCECTDHRVLACQPEGECLFAEGVPAAGGGRGHIFHRQVRPALHDACALEGRRQKCG